MTECSCITVHCIQRTLIITFVHVIIIFIIFTYNITDIIITVLNTIFYFSIFYFYHYTGGGALNVPIFYFIWGFTYKESVIMSLSTLMGNYLAQVSTNVFTLFLI